MRVLLALLACTLSSAAAAASWGCTLGLTPPAFGVYNPFATTPDEANGLITATCTLLSGNAATVTVTDSFSTGSSNAYSTRTMLSGTNVLNYNLYFDAAYTQIRGNGTGGSQTGSATLNLTTSNRTQTASGTVYGRVPPQQNVAPGGYADTIVVTITF